MDPQEGSGPKSAAGPGLELVFAGTPEFAATQLEALLQARRHRVLAVCTQPDRPAGRGHRTQFSAVKEVALAHGLPVWQPAKITAPLIKAIADLNPDLLVVAAYGLIIPQALLQLPRHGCLNVHASVLPRWRGAAPVERAIAAGDKTSGISIMQMDTGVDTGPVLLQKTCAIGPQTTGDHLRSQLARLGAEGLLETLELLAAERPLTARSQDQQAACWAPKLRREEARIQWHQSAPSLERMIRAFFSANTVHTQGHDGQPIQIHAARCVAGAGPAGQVIAANARDGLVVATGRDALQLIRLQVAGGRAAPATALLNGRLRWLRPGQRLAGSPTTARPAAPA